MPTPALSRTTDPDAYYLASGRNLQAATDSGMVSAYRPADHRKPQAQGLISRITRMFLRAFKRTDPEDTTERGSASAASPTAYNFSLLSLRYEHQQVIADCRSMVADDPRARRATLKFAREAVRAGVTITVKKAPGARAKARAQEITDDLCKLINPRILSWAWMLPVEGDLFVQAIVSGDRVTGLKRMPASSMERNTDDTDEFIDPAHAFSQIDIMTQEDVATFPLALMYHQRWEHIDGERYGTPGIAVGRRMRRLLELQEDSQAVRRMTRAHQQRIWNIGTDEEPGTEKEINDFKAANGFIEGEREVFNPLEAATDFFGNGKISATTLDGETNIADIGDIEHAQNVYVNGSLPTPSALLGIGAKDINRDVLEDMRAEWLKETSALSEAIKEVIRWIVGLALMLAGILPETVDFDVHLSESTIEKPGEIVDRVIKLRSATLGMGDADPLISKKTALTLIADIIGIDDVEEELKQIEAELDARSAKGMRETAQEQAIQGGASPEQAQQQAEQALSGSPPGTPPGSPDAGQAGPVAQMQQQASTWPGAGAGGQQRPQKLAPMPSFGGKR